MRNGSESGFNNSAVGDQRRQEEHVRASLSSQKNVLLLTEEPRPDSGYSQRVMIITENAEDKENVSDIENFRQKHAVDQNGAKFDYNADTGHAFKNGGENAQTTEKSYRGDSALNINFQAASSGYNAASDSALESNNLTYSESGFNPAGSLRYTMLGGSSYLCGSVHNGMQSGSTAGVVGPLG